MRCVYAWCTCRRPQCLHGVEIGPEGGFDMQSAIMRSIHPTSNAGSNIGSEHADGFSTETSRLPPVTLLAPLQLLQSHRRGSITSPKLHVAPNPPPLRPSGPIPGRSPHRRSPGPHVSARSLRWIHEDGHFCNHCFVQRRRQHQIEEQKRFEAG